MNSQGKKQKPGSLRAPAGGLRGKKEASLLFLLCSQRASCATLSVQHGAELTLFFLAYVAFPQSFIFNFQTEKIS